MKSAKIHAARYVRKEEGIPGLQPSAVDSYGDENRSTPTNDNFTTIYQSLKSYAASRAAWAEGRENSDSSSSSASSVHDDGVLFSSPPGLGDWKGYSLGGDENGDLRDGLESAMVSSPSNFITDFHHRVPSTSDIDGLEKLRNDLESHQKGPLGQHFEAWRNGEEFVDDYEGVINPAPLVIEDELNALPIGPPRELFMMLRDEPVVPRHIDFDTPRSVRTPMPTPAHRSRTHSGIGFGNFTEHVTQQILEARDEIRAKTAGKGAEGEWTGAVYNVVWWFCYLANTCALFLAVFVQPWDTAYLPGYHIMILLIVLGLVTTILIADISSDFICIAIATFCPSQQTKKVTCEPMDPDKAQKFLVVYCLKSNEKTDILETLSFLKASWRVNQSYTAASYCVLSGTQDAVLSAWEMSSIAQWNMDHAEDGGHVYYIRRTRGVLHKYGQYLDFIMLMNGYLEPMLYRDVKAKHPSGHCFDPSGDVEFFRGSDFEFLCVMDRDNMLSPQFFDYANRFFEAFPDLQILQPAITPFPKFFRRLLGSESLYTSLSAKFQVLGNELAEYKRVFIPSAAFYGKGIIRRSAYNKTLLGWNPIAGETQEENNIPRDLLSHDIIESSVMKTMLAPEIAVFEDFPLSHVEWHLRQGRWDLGDLIISKYLFPFSFGLMPNILCKFSYSFVRSFYQSYFTKMAAAIYSSTYNLRCILLKPVVVLSMIAYTFMKTKPLGLYGLAVFVNVQIILVPIFVSMYLVKGLNWKEKAVLQIHTVYMGICDIYFGSFRTLRAAHKIWTQTNKWRTFKALGNSPFMTMVVFVQSAQVELGIASIALAALLYFKWGRLQGTEYAIIAYVGIILTFPIYTFTTAFKKTGAVVGKDEGVPTILKDALLEIIDQAERLDDIVAERTAALEKAMDASSLSLDKEHIITSPQILTAPTSATEKVEEEDIEEGFNYDSVSYAFIDAVELAPQF